MNTNEAESDRSETGAKTDALFANTETVINQHGEVVNKEPKKSKGALVFYILSTTCAVVGAGAVTAIFSGRLSIPGGSETIYMERNEAIIASIVLIGLAILFTFLGKWVVASKIKVETIVANASEVPIEQYNTIRKKYKIFRITHYTILGTLLVSPIVGSVMEDSIVGDIFIGAFMLSLLAFIPVMVLLLVTKRKLKKIKASQSQ